MAEMPELSDHHGTMNKNLLRLALASLVALQLLLAGCASTAQGVKEDYKKLEDKV